VLSNTAEDDDDDQASSALAAHYTLEQARATATQLTAIAFAASGLSQVRAAQAAGVSRTLAQRWLDPECPRTIPLGQLLAMAQTSRRGHEAVVAILAGALSHIRSDCLPVVERRDLRGLVDDLHAEVGDVASEWRAAIADDGVSCAEAKSLLSELADVDRIVSQLSLELSRIALREG